MGIFSWAKGQFIDVIEWPEEPRDTLLWRFPDEDREVKNGAQLTVRESQAAILINEGQVADVFGAGRHELATRNLPILSSLRSWKMGFESPFKVDIYFVNLTQFSDQKWGTRAPTRVYDDIFPAGVDLRAFGTFNFRVADPGKFFREFAGNRSRVTTEDILGHFRSMIVTDFSAALKKSGKNLREIDATVHDLGDELLPHIQEDFAAIGTEVLKFYVESVTLPEEIRAELHRQDMEARELGREARIKNEVELENLAAKAQLSQQMGDMSKFAQLQAALAMEKGATNPSGGGAMSDMMQMMMGMGMAQNMAQNVQNSVGNKPAGGAGGHDEVMDALKKLGDLKTAGILSEEEFNTKKAELLARL